MYIVQYLVLYHVMMSWLAIKRRLVCDAFYETIFVKALNILFFQHAVLSLC